MKNLRLLQILIFALLMMSCDKDDGNDNNEQLSGDPGIAASINGGSFSNHTFTDGIYQITLGTYGTTMSIDTADIIGDQITLFLNGTGGFESGTVKNMGDLDSNNFTTYVNIRQSSTQISYFSTSGNVTIIENRAHPTEAGTRLISGTFNVSAASITDDNTTVMTGSFTELEYVD